MVALILLEMQTILTGDPDTGNYYTANPSSSPTISVSGSGSDTVDTTQAHFTVYMWYRAS